MTLTTDDLEGVDLDWFCVDGQGRIGHFATGGFGPVSCSTSMEELRRLASFFRNRTCERGTFHESPEWEKHAGISGANSRQKELYLSDYASFARRGLYSYSTPADWDTPPNYFRVVMPIDPLRVDELPDEIQVLLVPLTFPNLDFDRNVIITGDMLGDVVPSCHADVGQFPRRNNPRIEERRGSAEEGDGSEG